MSRERPSLTGAGPDGAPRDDGLDVRWSADYLYIVTSYPDVRPYLWGLAAAIYDQSRRNPNELNPFMRDDPGDARVPNVQPSAPHGPALPGVRPNPLRPVLPDAAGGRGELPNQGVQPRLRSVPRLDPHETPLGRVARLSPLGEPMLDKIRPYAKAIVAFIGAAVLVIGPEFAEDDDAQRWLRIVAGLATAVGVYFTPNKDPQALHQAESVQPPAPEYDAKHDED